MTQYLKQSTAATIPFGPLVDSGDASAETGLTISQADIRLSKNGAAFAQTNNSAGATHMENGFYGVPLNTTDTATLGQLRVAVAESGTLVAWQDFMVVTALEYDLLVSGIEPNGRGGRWWYVSSAGNNSNAGTKDSPKLTIGNAISSLSVNDSIYISNGTYNVSAGLTLSKANVEIRGQSRAGVDINYTYDETNAAFLKITADGCVIRYLDITTIDDGWPLMVQDANNILIEGCSLEGPLDGLAIETSNHTTVFNRDIVIRGNLISSDFDGLVAWNTMGLIVEGNNIIGRGTYPGDPPPATRGMLAFNCTGRITGNRIYANVPASGSSISSPHVLAGLLVGAGCAFEEISGNRIFCRADLTSYTGTIYGVQGSSDSGSILPKITVDCNLISVSQAGSSAAGVYKFGTTGTEPPRIVVHDAGVASNEISGNVELMTNHVVDTAADTADMQPRIATTGVPLINDAITASKFDETTAFPLAAADSGNNAVLRKGSGSVTGTSIEAAAGSGGGSSEQLNRIESLLQNDNPIIPDPSRTWTVRRTNEGTRSTKAIGRSVDDGQRLWVDLGLCLGVNQELGSVETMSINFGSSGVTSASESFDKAGNMVAFDPVGGTASDDDYEIILTIEDDDGLPLVATLLLHNTAGVE